MATTLKIYFNMLRPSIAKQLKEQGFVFDKDEAAAFEDARNAIFELSIQSLVTDKQEAQIKKKLFNRIQSHVKKKNKIKKADYVLPSYEPINDIQ